MTTGQTYVDIKNKRVLGQTDLKDNFLDYLREAIRSNFERMYNMDGVYVTKLTLAADGADKFRINGTSKATDGLGHVFDPAQVASSMVGIQFENTLAQDYWVSLTHATRPSGIQINPRTGLPEYVLTKEIIGYTDTPDSVVDNGDGTITFEVTTITGTEDHTGRKVLVYRIQPAAGATTEGVAIEECTVFFSAGTNYITTTGSFGQSTISTNAAHYLTTLLGPVVNTGDPSALLGFFVIGKVTGAGPGNPPSAFDTSAQFVFTTTLANISDITRIDSHGRVKIEVKADALDANEPQIEVKNFAGTQRFAVDENGDITILGEITGNVVPIVTNTYTLGSATKRFITAYFTNIDVTGNFVPAVDDAQDIGSAAFRWRDAFFSRELRIRRTGTAPTITLRHDSSGVDAKTWKLRADSDVLYLSMLSDDELTTVDFLAMARAGTVGLLATFAASLLPSIAGGYNLGHTLTRWGNALLSDSLAIQHTGLDNFPRVHLKSTNPGADAKTWWMRVSAVDGSMNIEAVSDDELTKSIVLRIPRTGIAADKVQCGTHLTPSSSIGADSDNTNDLGSQFVRWRSGFFGTDLKWTGGAYGVWDREGEPPQNIGGGFNPILFVTEKESSGVGDTGSNRGIVRVSATNYRLTRAGLYRVDFNICVESDYTITGDYAIIGDVNNATTGQPFQHSKRASWFHVTAGQSEIPTSLFGSAIIRVNANDEIQIRGGVVGAATANLTDNTTAYGVNSYLNTWVAIQELVTN